MRYKMMLIVLSIGIILNSCGGGSSPVQDEAPQTIIEPAPGDDGNKIFIVDDTGERWDITHAVNEYGFDTEQFFFGLGKDFIKPYLNPQFFVPGDAFYPRPDEGFISVGYKVGQDTRAYSLAVLKNTEVVDDDVGGNRVAVCYCPLANLTAVYSRKIDGRIVTLAASGWVYRDTFVLRDKETGSIWYPLEGTSGLTCIGGFYADRKLYELVSERARWSDWFARYPTSKFLVKGDGR